MENKITNANIIEALGEVIDNAKERDESTLFGDIKQAISAMPVKRYVKTYKITYFRNMSKNGNAYNKINGKYLPKELKADAEKSYFVNFSRVDSYKEPLEEGSHTIECSKIYVKDNSILVYGVKE